MLDKLKGYRTYIVAVLIGITTAVYQMGWIDRNSYDAILGFLGSLGLITLRAGIK